MSANKIWLQQEIEVMLLWLTGTPIEEIPEHLSKPLSVEDVRTVIEAYILNEGKRPRSEDEVVWVKLSDVYDACEGKLDVRSDR